MSWEGRGAVQRGKIREVESSVERITRDERSREERIIGRRDERAESKTASEIETGGAREGGRQTEVQRAAVPGQAHLNFNSLCARGRSGRQFTT